MPGALTMDGDVSNNIEGKAGGFGHGVGAKANPSETGKSYARGSPPPPPPPPQLDGPVEAPNGVYVRNSAGGGNVPAPTTNVASSPSLPHPPDLQHITEGYQPLGKLAERPAHQCFVGISDLVTEITDIDESEQPSQAGAVIVNGASHVNGIGSSVDASVRKRQRIIEWANDHRERFIKLLVLSQWCRQVDDVGKLIDLNAWAREQKYLYEQLAWDLGNLKRDLHGAQLPNPDIRTALEVLSTGKAPWMPDLGYIPPEPLTAQKMLKTLRNINALLSIRLNLHEDLLHHFKNFTIANGRATFIVTSEFEVDLSIADEDPQSQFFFIDFRLLFSPTSEIPTGQLRFYLEERANYVLSTEGLTGCYDFLHNFVLTHKINILRKQAIEMSRKAWSQTIRIEPVHRSLVIQYWLDRPGSKSWIEVGIASGKKQGHSGIGDGNGTPYIAVKWVRGGREVTDVNVPFNAAQLSLDLILRTVVTLHTHHILDSIRIKLAQMPLYARGSRLLALQTDLDSPDPDPKPAVLRFQGLGDDDPVFTLIIEPYTGRLTLQPAVGTMKLENDINRLSDPAVDAHLRLQGLLYGMRQSKIEQIAELSGWRIMRTLHSRIKWDAIKATFGQDVARCSFFRKEAWFGSTWTLALSMSSSGETWWIVETSAADLGIEIRTARAIPTRDSYGLSPPVTQNFLAKVEQFAIAMISFLVASQQLRALEVPHICQQTTFNEISGASASAARFALPALFIKFSALVKLQKAHKAWSHEWLRVSHHGLGSSGQADGKWTATQLVTGIMKKPLELRSTLLQSGYGDANVSFLPSGAFALALRFELGAQWIQELVARLRGIERLQIILDVLKHKKFEAESSSLSHILFSYAEGCRVEFTFKDGNPKRIRFLPQGNPHQRIRTQLATLLSEEPNNRSFAAFVDALVTTLPLLQAFDRLESAALLRRSSSPAPGPRAAPSTIETSLGVAIHPRNWRLYRIRFLTCTFDIELRRKRGSGPEWHITESTSSVVRTVHAQAALHVSSEVARRLRELAKEKGNGWKGLRGSRPSWAASVDGVKELLERLDQVVMGFSSEGLSSGNGSGPDLKLPLDDG